jgi:hypothetical protein
MNRPYRRYEFSGDNGGGETPDPIPNSEVKSSSADGTAGATLWESRTSPGLFFEAQTEQFVWAFFCVCTSFFFLMTVRGLSPHPEIRLFASGVGSCCLLSFSGIFSNVNYGDFLSVIIEDLLIIFLMSSCSFCIAASLSSSHRQIFRGRLLPVGFSFLQTRTLPSSVTIFPVFGSW